MPATELRTLTLGALLVIAGCAAPGGGRPTMADMEVVARNEAFALVRLQQGQTYADLAHVFLGHEGERWQLREVNAPGRDRAGQIVAVPLRPVNASSVYTNGYRALPILCYHRFTESSETSHRLEVSAEVFERQLRYLIDNDYTLLSFAEVDEIIREGRPIPERGVVITIDDGYRSVYEVAWPILRQHRAKATLFNYTDFIGAPAAMTWGQVREMAESDLIEVQSHAKSHSSLGRQPHENDGAAYRARVETEITGANAAFRQYLGTAPKYLSYPYGDSSELAAQVARDEGILLAATVTRGDNTVFTDPYLLHRTMIYDSHDMDEFRQLLRVFRELPLK